jgi:chemotaxis signal transduction protein
VTRNLPVLVLELARGRYLLPVAKTAGVREVVDLAELPFRDAQWDGMLDWQGHAVTVLNAAALLDDGAAAGEPVLLRLAPPYETIALRVDGRVRLERIDVDVNDFGEPQESPSTEHELGKWLDLTGLISRGRELSVGTR